jgi:transcriptional regulator with XRE-family HTH domain
LLLNINRLESLIKSKGWSKVYFSGLFDKNKGWITDMKYGRGIPDGNMLEQIANKLDTTVEYLTDQTDIKKEPPACRSKSRAFVLILFPLCGQCCNLLFNGG